ncbi:histone-like nucleoid-structuring protein Lsr2 [Nocardia tengchongensis]|uniref:histone-like nucleoid-structuring protein Lsr2 n=1 Tax=Nocardia tengchongensis TaxID=2055889 RepID=UPI00360D8316
MARKTRTIEEVFDDLTDEQVDEAELITFSVRGVDYEFDLSAASAKRFDDALAPFIEAAREVPRKKPARGSKKPARVRSNEPALIRKWAKEHGHKVAPRGRIDDDIVAAYHKAQKGSAAPATAGEKPAGAAS